MIKSIIILLQVSLCIDMNTQIVAYNLLQLTTWKIMVAVRVSNAVNITVIFDLITMILLKNILGIT